MATYTSTYTSKYTGSEVDALLEAAANKQDAITDLAKIAIASATCSTAGNTAAKAVTINNFILLTGGIISVYFTYGIVTQSTTLTISGTGTTTVTKPIFYHGAAVTPGVVVNGSTVMLQYDGTNWNIVSVERLIRNYGSDFVDLGLPSGTLWAKTNLDLTQISKFAASEYQYNCTMFTFGNTVGYNPDAQDEFSYTFSPDNYANTTGYSIPASTNITKTAYDAAKAALGSPWRIPSASEIQELLSTNNTTPVDANGDVISGTDKLTTINGIVGVCLKSKSNGNTLFLPAVGRVIGNTGSNIWTKRTTDCCYWSDRCHSADYGISLNINSSTYNYNNYNYRYQGLPIRPVM